jgi:predicted DNA-binding WGR domain protein
MKYEFIGWCQEGTSDKIWTVIQLRSNVNDAKSYSDTLDLYAVVWGRRGRTLQSKVQEYTYPDILSLIRSKTKKGYEEVSAEKLDSVYPEFEEDLQKTAVWAMLKA